RMIRPARLALLLLAVALAGCAGASRPARTGTEPAPRVRCLADPHETDTRPLFFLFCIQSP
ncbi:MAG TPA: hypothetical protein VFX28_17275, partial [Methylomirabilota bacterium]|nr:hypothetical protein [Methylomirabilota bacterium]